MEEALNKLIQIDEISDRLHLAGNIHFTPTNPMIFIY